jgi:hypothetical protein
MLAHPPHRRDVAHQGTGKTDDPTAALQHIAQKFVGIAGRGDATPVISGRDRK